MFVIYLKWFRLNRRCVTCFLMFRAPACIHVYHTCDAGKALVYLAHDTLCRDSRFNGESRWTLRLGDHLAMPSRQRENPKSSTPLPSWPLSFSRLRRAWHRGTSLMSEYGDGNFDGGRRNGVSSSSHRNFQCPVPSRIGTVPGCRGSVASGSSC